MNATKTPLPSYAVDLLLAAKAMLGNNNATEWPEALRERVRLLSSAVELFENSMPLTADGEIIELD
ncbi:hypothetical protein [Chitinibacter tainanensis]|uniref:hypothetical protein n=1 Tax=Chitinibacter tainanensis TaxID=230667 RepID=UPI0023559357|nr:hypothetical protein [Chitinibacter tainanensis]